MIKKNTTIISLLILVIIALLLCLLIKSRKDIVESSNYTLPNSFDGIKGWVTSTIPNTNLRFSYRPILEKSGLDISIEPYTQDGPYKQSGLKIFAKVDDINTLLVKSVAQQDSNIVADYCLYPSFTIIMHPVDSSKTFADFVRSEVVGGYDNEYASGYGLFSLINGKKVFLYKYTEDKSGWRGFVLTKNGIAEILMPIVSPCVYLGEDMVKKFNLSNFIDEYSYFNDFSFIDVLKSVAYLN